MIQDARQHAQRAFGAYEVCSAKARVRTAARRPVRPSEHPPSAKHAAARVVADNPGAAAAVTFALLAAVGPVRVIRTAVFVARFAPLAALGLRALAGSSDERPASERMHSTGHETGSPAQP